MGTSAAYAYSAPVGPWVDRDPSSDAIVRQHSAVAAITARTHGAATSLVGIAWIDEFQAIIVRRDAGLRTSRDLRDRRIGLPAAHLQSGNPRVHALRGAAAALESEGFHHRHVQWVDLPSSEIGSLTLPTAYASEIAALQDGAVDAVYVRGPAGLEATRAAGARLLFNIGAHQDRWVKTHTALLQAVTVSEPLLRAHPEVVDEALLERWPLLPAATSLEEASVSALATLKAFMSRWGFIHTDFTLDSWIDGRGAPPPVAPRRPVLQAVVS